MFAKYRVNNDSKFHLSPLLGTCALNLSQHQSLFQWVDSLHQVAKVLELQLQLSISPSSEYSGLISFRIEWLDILAVQGTLKSLLQLKSIDPLARSLLMVQLSHLYMTTGKTIALTIWTFVHKVLSLLFNMLPRFVMYFLPRSNTLLISWLQLPSVVILGPKKISLSLFPLFPHLFAMKWWDWMPWS